MPSRESKKREEETLRALQQLLQLPENQTCADCGAYAPRWASCNIGCFLCIRCGGIHRKFGSTSKIKSITLDKWTDDQIQVMRDNGNAKVNAFYLPNPTAFPPPTHSDHDMEVYIRDKYERQMFRVQSTSDKAREVSNFAGQLRTLANMGFTDNQICIDALQKANGKIDAAIEIMCNRPPSPIRTTMPNPQQPQLQPPKPTQKIDSRFSGQIERLRTLGFTDNSRNLEALTAVGGNLDAAVNHLLENSNQKSGGRSRSASQQRQARPNSAKGNQKMQGGFQNGQQPEPIQQTQPQVQSTKKSAIDDLLGMEDAFSPQTVQNQFQQNQYSLFPHQQGFSQQLASQQKDGIMSLFHTNYLPQQQFQQSNSFVGIIPQQQQQNQMSTNGYPQNNNAGNSFIQNQSVMLQGSQNQALQFIQQQTASQQIKPFQQSMPPQYQQQIQIPQQLQYQQQIQASQQIQYQPQAQSPQHISSMHQQASQRLNFYQDRFGMDQQKQQTQQAPSAFTTGYSVSTGTNPFQQQNVPKSNQNSRPDLFSDLPGVQGLSGSSFPAPVQQRQQQQPPPQQGWSFGQQQQNQFGHGGQINMEPQVNFGQQKSLL